MNVASNFNYYQVALLALVPKGTRAKAADLAAATTWPLSVVEKQLRDLIVAGDLVLDHEQGEYHLPEKS